jgi:hypothetical protein
LVEFRFAPNFVHRQHLSSVFTSLSLQLRVQFIANANALPCNGSGRLISSRADDAPLAKALQRNSIKAARATRFRLFQKTNACLLCCPLLLSDCHSGAVQKYFHVNFAHIFVLFFARSRCHHSRLKHFVFHSTVWLFLGRHISAARLGAFAIYGLGI